MKRRFVKIDKKSLEKMIIEEKKTVAEIAKDLGFTYASIYRCIKKYELGTPMEIKLTKINKELMYDEYIIKNKGPRQIANDLGISYSSVCDYIRKFNLVKNKEKLESGRLNERKKTNLNKYGVEHTTQLKEVKEKIKKTTQERYGVDNCFKNLEVQEKFKKTMQERYGVNYTLEHGPLRDSAFKTILENFGVEYASQSEEIQRKTIDTNIQRYGVKNILCSGTRREEIKNELEKKYGVREHLSSPEIRKKIEETTLQKYGVKNIMQSQDFRSKMIQDRIDSGSILTIDGKTISDISEEESISETKIRSWIYKNPEFSIEDLTKMLAAHRLNMTSIEHIVSEKMNLPFFNKKASQDFPYKPDFKITESCFLNVDGLYWHSELCKNDTKYHFNLRKSFENNGCRIFQFREDEVYKKFNIIESMINNLLNKNNKVYARKTQIKLINQKEASCFLNDNHIMGEFDARHLGLYIENNLVCILSYKIFGKTLKVERFCSKLNHSVIGGFGKLLKFVEKENLEIKNIHYWVDLRYGTGNFLLKNNFVHARDTLGWKWTDLKNTFNRLQCRANMDVRGLMQKQHAKELGWCKIYDAGQRLYIKEIK